LSIPHDNFRRLCLGKLNVLRLVLRKPSAAELAQHHSPSAKRSLCRARRALRKSATPKIYARWKKNSLANVVRILTSSRSDHRGPRDQRKKRALSRTGAVSPSLTKHLETCATLKRAADELLPSSRAVVRRSTKRGNPTLSRTVPRLLGAFFSGGTHKQRPYRASCDGCHSVGYDIQDKQGPRNEMSLERCHGPGCEHAAPSPRTNIVNPAHMNTSDAKGHLHPMPFAVASPCKSPIEGIYDWPVGIASD